MNGLQKIGDIAIQYNVTSRTLRYYEEIGLLNSMRLDNSQYRFYDEKALLRLEQILFLRKLDLSVKDVKEILSSEDLTVLLNIFNHKISSLKKDIKGMESLKFMLEEFLNLLTRKGYKTTDSVKLLQQSALIDIRSSKNKKPKHEIEMEDFSMDNQINKLTDSDIRLIKLRPMKVAYYRTESTSPEQDAWRVMREWVKENNLKDLFTTRYFGFNNPSPTQGNPVYGYEVWVTLGDNAPSETELIKFKSFEGGLYAVTNTSGNGDDIPMAWDRLHNWVEQSQYCYGGHQWLEENLIVDDSSWGPEKFTLDLYYPLKLK
jgi:DNA-binding transcriptional MerR regulator/DNA gyrase inhibitor GyrI